MSRKAASDSLCERAQAVSPCPTGLDQGRSSLWSDGLELLESWREPSLVPWPSNILGLWLSFLDERADWVVR